MELMDFFESPSGVVKLYVDPGSGGVDWYVFVGGPVSPTGKLMKAISFEHALDVYNATKSKLDPEILLS